MRCCCQYQRHWHCCSGCHCHPTDERARDAVHPNDEPADAERPGEVAASACCSDNGLEDGHCHWDQSSTGSCHRAALGSLKRGQGPSPSPPTGRTWQPVAAAAAVSVGSDGVVAPMSNPLLRAGAPVCCREAGSGPDAPLDHSSSMLTPLFWCADVSASMSRSSGSAAVVVLVAVLREISSLGSDSLHAACSTDCDGGTSPGTLAALGPDSAHCARGSGCVNVVFTLCPDCTTSIVALVRTTTVLHHFNVSVVKQVELFQARVQVRRSARATLADSGCQ